MPPSEIGYCTPVKNSSRADIYKISGNIHRSVKGMAALKVLRVLPNNDVQRRMAANILDQIARLAAANCYDSPRICSLFVTSVLVRGNEVKAVVSSWYKNGNVLDFVAGYHDANRMRLTIDVADAVAFVHSQGVVIGNLHAKNVMVDDDGRVILTDVGMQPLSDQLYLDMGGNIPSSDSWPYKPPEEMPQFLDDRVATAAIFRTIEMDVYSFGTVTCAIHTGEPPVPGGMTTPQAIMQIALHGHRVLGMPTAMHEKVWHSVVWRCLDKVPQNRPVISEAVVILKQIVGDKLL